jgi:hypothetical protein
VGKLTFDYDNFDLEHEIVPGLWMGGTHDEDVVSKPSKLPVMSARKEFDAVVTLDSYARPFGWFVKEFRFGFADGPLPEDHAQEIERIADWAFIEWKAGCKTLIRCQAGLNRSGLVTALVLLRDGKKLDEVLTLIRAKRGEYALSNNEFMEYLRAWKAPRRR